MSTKSILSFFQPKSQDVLIESSSVDKRTTDICNVKFEMVYSDSESTSTPKRRKYQIMSTAERAEIRKYASQHSTPQTIAHFKSRFNLKRKSVRNLKSKYLGELSRKPKLFDLLTLMTVLQMSLNYNRENVGDLFYLGKN